MSAGASTLVTHSPVTSTLVTSCPVPSIVVTANIQWPLSLLQAGRVWQEVRFCRRHRPPLLYQQVSYHCHLHINSSSSSPSSYWLPSYQFIIINTILIVIVPIHHHNHHIDCHHRQAAYSRGGAHVFAHSSHRGVAVVNSLAVDCWLLRRGCTGQLELELVAVVNSLAVDCWGKFALVNLN